MSETLFQTLRRLLRPTPRHRETRPGRIERIEAFESKLLRNQRDLTVYLPPGYDTRAHRYPVLYLQDGQNLFEPERAFIPGQHWRLREAADEAIAGGAAEPMIIVGIDNAGSHRIDEYTPSHDQARGGGGKADHYARMLLEEIKPMIDRRFRTLTGGAHTGLGGSSMGGLATMYLGLRHPDAFTRLAVMSPSVWWKKKEIVGEVAHFSARVLPRVWLDIGMREGAEAMRDVRELRDRLIARGWVESDDLAKANLRYVEDRAGDHSELSWAERAQDVLEFLFPASPPGS
jgi:predicted alpha/beta superfamily hydrolase